MYIALMKIQLEFNKPVINNILNCYTLAQVTERFEKTKGIVDTVKFLIN
jgi:6,7-dimethyl-8-ribityllumazine synthase